MMQADDELSHDLAFFRQQHATAANPREAKRVCATALGRCQAAGRPLPEWLYSAIMSYLHPVTDRERKQWDDDKNAMQRLEAVAALLGPDEAPSMKHFRAAKDELGPGDPISPGALRKLWQRQGDTYLAAMKLKAGREQ